MKKLLNDVADVVPQMLEGLVAGAPGLVLLQGETVVLRRAHADLGGRVALVSGGGAGHEPAHGGYVGPGMLTGAVVGDMFTSPSTDAVLAAVRAIAAGEQARSAGVLLIVKNYTGDRLNFGLAAELARAEGTDVEMVVIGDDVALAADGDHAGRRGIAGTVLVHKAAGAAAARGDDLAAVRAVAQRVADEVRSMGVSLGACTVPAVGRPGFTLADDEVEWGLGIHGEAGVERGPLLSADDTTARLVDAVVDDAGLAEGRRVVLLVNDLGTTPPSELDVVARGALARLRSRGLVVERMWVGRFLTALDMPGVSVSVLGVDDELLTLLDAPTETAAWPAPHQGLVAEPEAVAPPAPAEEPTGERLAADSVVRRGLVAACESLKAAEPELTRLDSEVGDGDLGTGLERGADAVLAEVDRYAADAVGALRDTSATLRRAIGGTSGPLYSILLMRAAASLEESGSTDPAAWAAALRAGADGIAEVGGASVGDRTMLDALVPLATSFAQHLEAGDDPASAWRDAVAAAEQGTASTAETAARVGRSSYLGDRVKGTPDPGARAVVIWAEAVGEAVG